jgi:hypothetical protein
MQERVKLLVLLLIIQYLTNMKFLSKDHLKSQLSYANSGDKIRFLKQKMQIQKWSNEILTYKPFNFVQYTACSESYQ